MVWGLEEFEVCQPLPGMYKNIHCTKQTFSPMIKKTAQAPFPVLSYSSLPGDAAKHFQQTQPSPFPPKTEVLVANTFLKLISKNYGIITK